MGGVNGQGGIQVTRLMELMNRIGKTCLFIPQITPTAHTGIAVFVFHVSNEFKANFVVHLGLKRREKISLIYHTFNFLNNTTTTS